MAVPEIVQDSGWTNSPMHTATSQWQDDGKPTKGKIMSEQIVEVVKAVAWPVVVFALLVLFRHPLSKMLNDLGNRASRINIWKISVDLAVATPLPQPMSLRLSEIRDPVCALIDSDARRDLEALLGARPKADYAIVDLGTGDSWMTCRLFIFAFLVDNSLDVRCLVFVRTQDGIGNLFSGLASPTAVWRRLEDDYGQALRRSRYASGVLELQNLGRVYGLHLKYQQARAAREEDYTLKDNLLDEFASLVPIFDFRDPQAGAQLLTNFLDDPWISRSLDLGMSPGGGWVGLADQQRQERAEWIRDEDGLRRILGPAWQRPTVIQTGELHDEEIYQRALLRQGDFVAVVDSKERFIKLIDRMGVAEAVGRTAVEVHA